MFQVAIVLNNTDANCSLSFKTKEAAEVAYVFLKEAVKSCDSGSEGVQIPDDYGYVFYAQPKHIAYVLFVDIERSQLVMFDKDMAMQRANKKIQESLEAMGFKPQPQKKPSIIHN